LPSSERRFRRSAKLRLQICSANGVAKLCSFLSPTPLHFDFTVKLLFFLLRFSSLYSHRVCVRHIKSPCTANQPQGPVGVRVSGAGASDDVPPQGGQQLGRVFTVQVQPHPATPGNPGGAELRPAGACVLNMKALREHALNCAHKKKKRMACFLFFGACVDCCSDGYVNLVREASRAPTAVFLLLPCSSSLYISY